MKIKEAVCCLTYYHVTDVVRMKCAETTTYTQSQLNAKQDGNFIDQNKSYVLNCITHIDSIQIVTCIFHVIVR